MITEPARIIKGNIRVVGEYKGMVNRNRYTIGDVMHPANGLRFIGFAGKSTPDNTREYLGVYRFEVLGLHEAEDGDGIANFGELVRMNLLRTPVNQPEPTEERSYELE